MAGVRISDNAGMSITPRIIGGVTEPNANPTEETLGIPIKIDRLGRIEIGFSSDSIGDASYYPKNYSSTSYESGSIVKNSSGIIYKIIGFNSGSSQFIQLYDSNIHPNDGDIPKITYLTPEISNFEIPIYEKGFWFNNGIVIMNSISGSMLLSGSENCFFTVTYI